ncbi:HDOD domain-containing protein [Desulfonatronospira thiodismutans]|nr:HDOD domain-containing protein [Desulfonatronospira thiodismutans]
MVANIMKVVMNSFAGDSKTPSTLEAVSQTLGVEMIKELICRREEFAAYQDFLYPDYSILQLWRHSLRTARYAAAIAATQSSDPLFVDQCYTAGLLHDVGKMVLLLKFGEEYVQSLKKTMQEEIPVRDAETRAFNTTHEAAGAYLLCLWGLPLKTLEAVAFHSRPGYTRGAEFKPVTAVHVANILDHYFLGFSARHSKRQLDQSFLEKNGFMERMPVWKKACASVYAREIQEQKKLIF